MLETRFPQLADLDLIFDQLRDMSEMLFPTVSYIRLNRDATRPDPVRREVQETDKVFYEPIELRAYIVPDEEKPLLTAFGIDRTRDMVLKVSVPVLSDAGLLTIDPDTFKIALSMASGDRFRTAPEEWGWDYYYDILDVKPAHRFANTDVPLYYIFGCERVRPDAIDLPDDEEYEEPDNAGS